MHPALGSRLEATLAWRNFEAYVWLLPALGFFAVFFVYPLIIGGRIAFSQWSGFTPIDQMKPVGIKNFAALAQDKVFWQVLRNSATWAIASTALFTGIGFLLAFSLWHRPPKGSGLLRAFILYPSVLSSVIVSLAWYKIYALDGLLNGILSGVTHRSVEIFWLVNLKITFWAVLWTYVWQGTGFTVVLLLAAMSAIPSEIVDSARVDGAGSAQLARHIVWPLIGHAIAITLLINVIGGIQVFTPMWVMTQGGPLNSTATLATYSFQEAFSYARFGYAAAITMVGVAILFIFAVIRIRATRIV